METLFDNADSGVSFHRNIAFSGTNVNKSIFKCKETRPVILFVSKTWRCEHYEALNTHIQCVFHSSSKPEGAVALKDQSGLTEVSYDGIQQR